MKKLSLNEFNYNLPENLIAQIPAKPRDHARLLCLGLSDGKIKHSHFDKLGEELRPGDILVLNDSKVFPARLIGKKEISGGKIEVFLHQVIKDAYWECLVGGRVRPGLKIIFGHGLQAILKKDNGDGTWTVFFNKNGQVFWNLLNKIGKMPLPPYINSGKNQKTDRSNYQTVYANDKNIGSVAAPTAGLHFTKRLLSKLQKQGVEIINVTLHVGLGTFASVKEDDITKHKMHSEYIVINKSSAKKLLAAKEAKRRIIAVGTTSCRVLESYGQMTASRRLSWGDAYQGWTDIFIYPGYNFQVISALITNFHLPKSSLLMLVSALAGKENIKHAYALAVKEKYRFFSYGDAMFIG